jgi:hypothetical protein
VGRKPQNTPPCRDIFQSITVNTPVGSVSQQRDKKINYFLKYTSDTNHDRYLPFKLGGPGSILGRISTQGLKTVIEEIKVLPLH